MTIFIGLLALILGAITYYLLAPTISPASSFSSKANHTAKTGDWGVWIFINAPLLSIAGFVVFGLLVEFGSRGYVYIIPSTLIITLLVGVIHWHILKKQAYANQWVIITTIAWLVTICSIPIFLGDNVDLLSRANEVPGAGILGLCIYSAGVGPVVAIIAALALKSVS